MLRCDICRSHAHAGLGHIHGAGMTLCRTCSNKVMELRTLSALAAAVNVEGTSMYLRSVLNEKSIGSTPRFDYYEHTETVPLSAV